MKIAFLFTCYNRINKTRKCVETVSQAVEYANKRYSEDKSTGEIEAVWFITDAGSEDGTLDVLNDWSKKYKMHICVEKNVYYSQGMRICMNMALDDDRCDYYILINDDVEFYEEFLYKMLMSDNQNADDSMHPLVLVGATDDGKKQTYGGIRYTNGLHTRNHFAIRSIKYDMVRIEDMNTGCHAFNANCVLVENSVFYSCGVMDEVFIHGLGDFDYGLNIYEKNGDIIQSTDYFVGRCMNNSKTGTWMDKSLSRIERIRKLNSVKGSPTRQWFYYLYKHFGFITACVHSISPYIRIVLKK